MLAKNAITSATSSESSSPDERTSPIPPRRVAASARPVLDGGCRRASVRTETPFCPPSGHGACGRSSGLARSCGRAGLVTRSLLEDGRQQARLCERAHPAHRCVARAVDRSGPPDRGTAPGRAASRRRCAESCGRPSRRTVRTFFNGPNCVCSVRRPARSRTGCAAGSGFPCARWPACRPTRSARSQAHPPRQPLRRPELAAGDAGGATPDGAGGGAEASGELSGARAAADPPDRPAGAATRESRRRRMCSRCWSRTRGGARRARRGFPWNWGYRGACRSARSSSRRTGR